MKIVTVWSWKIVLEINLYSLFRTYTQNERNVFPRAFSPVSNNPFHFYIILPTYLLFSLSSSTLSLSLSRSLSGILVLFLNMNVAQQFEK